MEEYPTVMVCVPSKNILGEGPVWDYRTCTLYWVDIKGKKFETYVPSTEVRMEYAVSDLIGFLALTENPDLVLLGLRNFGFTLYRLSTRTEHPWVHPEPLLVGETRLNDGKVDALGRCVAGTMDWPEGRVPFTLVRPIGSVYTLEGDVTVTKHDMTMGPVTISNGLDWDDASRSMYYIDSPTRVVKRFGYDAGTGRITGPGEVVYDLDADGIGGVPDGMALDSSLMLWVCCWDAGVILRIDVTTKTLRGVLKVPVSRPTAVAFGSSPQDPHGPLDTLYITSAQSDSGDGGDVYLVKIPGVIGRRTNLFKLSTKSL